MLTYIFLAIALLLIAVKFVILTKQKKRGITEAETDRRLLTMLNNESESHEKKASHPVAKK